MKAPLMAAFPFNQLTVNSQLSTINFSNSLLQPQQRKATIFLFNRIR